jgi:hypothetical protein
VPLKCPPSRGGFFGVGCTFNEGLVNPSVRIERKVVTHNETLPLSFGDTRRGGSLSAHLA